MHGGSTSKDSEGCVLLGEQLKQDGMIGNCRVYQDLLNDKIKDEIDVSITIK
jgi:hypothetical protein